MAGAEIGGIGRTQVRERRDQVGRALVRLPRGPERLSQVLYPAELLGVIPRTFRESYDVRAGWRQRVVTGVNAIAGEWGHNALPWPQAEELPGRECYCGKSGCIETYLSGPALARDYERATGQRLPAEEVAARGRQAIAGVQLPASHKADKLPDDLLGQGIALPYRRYFHVFLFHLVPGRQPN